jgi:hypothetical protein
MKVTKITKALLSRKRIEKSFPSLGSYSKSDISREAMVLRRSFGKDMEKGLYRSPPIISMKGELANVAGRKKEIKVFQSKVKKIQSAVASRVRSKQKQFGSKARLFEKKTVPVFTPSKTATSKTYYFNPQKPPTKDVFKRTSFGKLVKQKQERLISKAFGLSKVAGMKQSEKVAQKLGIPSDKYKVSKIKYSQKRKTTFMGDDDITSPIINKKGDILSPGTEALSSMRFAKRKGVPSEPRGNIDPYEGMSVGLPYKKLKAMTGKSLKIKKPTIEIESGDEPFGFEKVITKTKKIKGFEFPVKSEIRRKKFK